jgi:hypothetical protein
MYTAGSNLAKRSNADGAIGWNASQALTILYHIALSGEYVATQVHFPLGLLTAACQRLEMEEFNCYWCGVHLLKWVFSI